MEATDLPDATSGIFFAAGLDDPNQLEPAGEFRFSDASFPAGCEGGGAARQSRTIGLTNLSGGWLLFSNGLSLVERPYFRATLIWESMVVTTRFDQPEIPMAESVDVQVTGKSPAEIAHAMAREILIVVEGKSLKNVTRAEYLNAHVDAVNALRGSRPDR